MTLSLLCALFNGAAHAQTQVARVLDTRGTALVERSSQVPRLLGAGEQLGERDVINVARDSWVILEFSDQTRVTLRPNTVFRLDSYKADAPEAMLLGLVRGGLRAVTGLFGKRNPSGVRFQTAVATIGIRGTEFDARLCEADCAAEERARPALRPLLLPVARVVEMNGVAAAARAGEPGRVLVPGAALYEGDGVATGPGAHALLVFRDGARVTLAANSRFAINRFRFSASFPRNGGAFLTLLAGNAHVWTGQLAKISPDAFLVRSAMGVIRPYGTGFSLSGCIGSACASVSGNVDSSGASGSASGSAGNTSASASGSAGSSGASGSASASADGNTASTSGSADAGGGGGTFVTPFSSGNVSANAGPGGASASTSVGIEGPGGTRAGGSASVGATREGTVSAGGGVEASAGGRSGSTEVSATYTPRVLAKVDSSGAQVNVGTTQVNVGPDGASASTSVGIAGPGGTRAGGSASVGATREGTVSAGGSVTGTVGGQSVTAGESVSASVNTAADNTRSVADAVVRGAQDVVAFVSREADGAGRGASDAARNLQETVVSGANQVSEVAARQAVDALNAATAPIVSEMTALMAQLRNNPPSTEAAFRQTETRISQLLQQLDSLQQQFMTTHISLVSSEPVQRATAYQDALRLMVYGFQQMYSARAVERHLTGEVRVSAGEINWQAQRREFALQLALSPEGRTRMELVGLSFAELMEIADLGDSLLDGSGVIMLVNSNVANSTVSQGNAAFAAFFAEAQAGAVAAQQRAEQEGAAARVAAEAAKTAADVKLAGTGTAARRIMENVLAQLEPGSARQADDKQDAPPATVVVLDGEVEVVGRGRIRKGEMLGSTGGPVRLANLAAVPAVRVDSDPFRETGKPVEEGLYVWVRDGAVQVAKDDKVVDVSAGNAAVATKDKVELLDVVPNFLRFDQTPRPVPSGGGPVIDTFRAGDGAILNMCAIR